MGAKKLKDGYLGLMKPLLHVDKDGMLKVLRSAWKNPDLKLPGFKILFAGNSEAPIWGADYENFGQVAVIEVSLKETEERLGFQLDDDGNVEFGFGFEAALAYTLAILTVADFDSARKFSKVAFYSQKEFAQLVAATWIPPRFVWLRIFQQVEELELSADFLFDSEAYPEFDEAWLDDPMSLLNELEIAAADFADEATGLFDVDGTYTGEKVQPAWMSEFKPKN